VPDIATIIEERVSFSGVAGQIEGMLAYPEHDEPQESLLIVGPHPMLGGDFENNVVRELADLFAERRCLTLRFNFRGVGQSDGAAILSTDNIAEFWARSRISDEQGFAEDTASAADFLITTFDQVSHVVGYSFGAWLGSRWASESVNRRQSDEAPTTATDVRSVTLVAPTISQHDYSHMTRLNLPKLVIASSDDFAVPADDLRRQFADWSDPKELILEDVDNHFFRGHEAWLSDQVSTFLRGET